jgi:hypothetical protein
LIEKCRLGYDSAHAYYRTSGSTEWIRNNIESSNIGYTYWPKHPDRRITIAKVCLDNGSELTIYIKKNTQVSVHFSIPKVLYGNNFFLSNHIDTSIAVDMVSHILGLDFESFTLSRLDTTISLPIAYKHEELLRMQHPNHHKLIVQEEGSIYYGTYKEKSSRELEINKFAVYARSDEIEDNELYKELDHCERILVFYNKNYDNNYLASGILRVESRINTGNKLMKFISPNISVGDMLTERFYRSSANYLAATLGTLLKRTNKFANDRNPYFEMIESSFLKVCSDDQYLNHIKVLY